MHFLAILHHVTSLCMNGSLSGTKGQCQSELYVCAVPWRVRADRAVYVVEHQSAGCLRAEGTWT